MTQAAADNTDPIADAIARLRAAFSSGKPLDDGFWAGFETDIRTTWGGDRHYIHATGPREIALLQTRNRAIVRDRYINHLDIKALQEKYGLARRTLYDIISSTPLPS